MCFQTNETRYDEFTSKTELGRGLPYYEIMEELGFLKGDRGWGPFTKYPEGSYLRVIEDKHS